MKIGLISDTHSYFDPQIREFFSDRDEIWHAGDIGSRDVITSLEKLAPVRAVYGNIDDALIRAEFPEDLFFDCEGIKVWITHIGGYPGRYNQRTRTILANNKLDLFICGHSHILKVIPDKKHQLLHINPGAAGFHGFHKFKTLIRFTIESGKIQNLEAIELGKRGI
ncbi:MAG: metallophosphoesterase family protein [Chitinophagales bacterium]